MKYLRIVAVLIQLSVPLMSFSQINWSLSDTGIPSGYSPNDFTILPNGDIYLACSQFVSTSFTPKLMKSEDSGSTWKEISMSGLTSLQNTNAIQYHAGKLLLSGSNSANAAYYVYSSIDSGKNWSLSNTGIPSGYSPNDFTILPNGDIYLACSQFVSTSFAPKLMKSEDSGSTWKEISMSGLTSLQNINAIQYHAGRLLLSGSNSANATYYVYSSIDSGKNWSLSNIGIPSGYSPNDFTILPNGDIYLACSQFVSTSFTPKLMKSEDSGSTWKEISMSGLTSLQNTNSIQYYAGKLLLSGSNSVSGSYYVFRSELIYSPPTRTLKDNVILDVAIFPNPVSTLLYIENVDCTYYRVFDINGKILSDGNLSLGLNSINLSNLPKGEYIIQVKNLTNAMYATVIKL